MASCVICLREPCSCRGVSLLNKLKRAIRNRKNRKLFRVFVAFILRQTPHVFGMVSAISVSVDTDSSSLLGGLLVTTIGLAAFSRADIAPQERRDFFLYIDEFQSFTTLAVANMLSEIRKNRVAITTSHQHLHQLEPEIRHAVLGNAGTLMSFRLGAEDAGYIAREFGGRFEASDLINLPNRHIYLKLMVDGQPTKAFSART